jgi:hypothetical protein
MIRWLPLLLLAGCVTRGSLGAPQALAQADDPITFDTGKVDILFMIDNSPSIDAMQNELRAHFGDLLTQVAGLAGREPVDLHVGVVTSDYGAGDRNGPTNSGCFASPGPDAGRLQALGAAAAADCRPPVGASYLSYAVDAAGNVTTNAPDGQDALATFTCMASVGSRGCGFEHPLESVYAALKGDGATSGFLRDDASLTVVFLTNEDDGSAPPTSQIYESNADPNVTGAFDTFRQTYFGIACGTPPTQIPLAAGTLHDCVPAPGNGVTLSEFDVSRYIDLFTRSRANGGVKDDPTSVALIAIAPPVPPTLEVIQARVGTGLGQPPSPTYTQCDGFLSDMCVLRLQHSCQNHTNPAFFGDAPVRLDAVVQAAPTHQLIDICGDDLDAPPAFGASAMKTIATVVTQQATAGCLRHAPILGQATPCTVSFDGSLLQSCDGRNAGVPCWRIVPDTSCPTVRDPLDGSDRAYRLELVAVAPSAYIRASCTVYTGS